MPVGVGREPLQAFYLVEMAGIEPASKEFGWECATSLVGLLFFAQASPDQQDPAWASRSRSCDLAFDAPYRRREHRTPMSMASDPDLSGEDLVRRGCS